MSLLRSRGLAAIGLAALMAVHAPSAQAEVVEPPAPVEITGTVTPIRTGPGSQNDPHISGTLVSYSDDDHFSFRGIRYVDLLTGADAAIPTDGQFDSLSDVSGTTVVSRRVYTDGSSSDRPIQAFDTADPAAGATILDPDVEARRSFPSIGGSTVAWTQYSGAIGEASEIVVHTLGGATTSLTSAGASSRDPDVSPDGDVVTWVTCAESGLACDLFAARKDADGSWGGATRLSGDGSEEIYPVTNGAVVVYASDAAGDFDIWWERLDGTGEHRLTMTGDEYHAAVSGSLIVFAHQDAYSSTDLFAYDMATGALYQLTDTPTVRESLPDVAVDGNGVARVVWAQADGLQVGDNDIYAMTFQVPGADTHRLCPQFDQSRSHRVGSTVPLRVRLCDDAGQNLSSPDTVLTATGLVKLDGSASSALAEDSGNANPDSDFRYDEPSGQYIFNLATKSLSAGTWQLDVVVSGDPTTYKVTFDLR